MTAPQPMSFRHVLLATDLSEGSLRAQQHAIDLAERFGAQLTILHVLEPIGYAFVLPQYDEVRRTAQAEVDEIARLAHPRVRQVGAVVADGAPALEVIDAAQKLGADLVVVGTHGRSGLRHVLLGSVAEKIVRNCDVPVLTVASWRFSDLRHAARQLAQKLRVPPGALLVGVGRTGAMLAAELSELTGAPADAFLVAPIDIEGRIAGFVGEDGTTTLRPGEDVPGMYVEEAREMVAAERKILRARQPRVEVCGRPVVVVSHRVDDELAVKTAAVALREAGATQLVGAFAAASALAQDGARTTVDQTIVIETLDPVAGRELVYRARVEASIGAVRRKLRRTSHVLQRRAEHGDEGARTTTEEHRSEEHHTVRVRAVPGGFAVFGHGSELLSGTFHTREDAVAEAEEEAGEGGIVLVESPTGHIEREVHASHPRRDTI